MTSFVAAFFGKSRWNYPLWPLLLRLGSFVSSSFGGFMLILGVFSVGDAPGTGAGWPFKSHSGGGSWSFKKGS